MIHEYDDIPTSRLLYMLKTLLNLNSKRNSEMRNIAIGGVLQELKRRGIDWNEV